MVISGAPGWGFYCLIIVNARQQSLPVDHELGFGLPLQRFHLGPNSFQRINAGAKAGKPVSKQSNGPNRSRQTAAVSTNSAGVHWRTVTHAGRKLSQLHVYKNANGSTVAA